MKKTKERLLALRLGFGFPMRYVIITSKHLNLCVREIMFYQHLIFII